MIPVRILLVDDPGPRLRRNREALESAPGLEVYAASSASAGLLGMARLRPDLLLLNPATGGSRPESWRRTIDRYRNGRSLGLLLLADAHGSGIEALAELADLGSLPTATDPDRVHEVVLSWAGREEREEEALSQAG